MKRSDSRRALAQSGVGLESHEYTWLQFTEFWTDASKKS